MWGNGEEAQGSMVGGLSYYHQSDHFDADYHANEAYFYQNLNNDGYDYKEDVDGWRHEYPDDEDDWYPDNFGHEDFYDGEGYDDQSYHFYRDDAPYGDEEDGMRKVPWYPDNLSHEDFYDGEGYDDQSYHFHHNDAPYDDEEDGINEVPWYENPSVGGNGDFENYQLENPGEDSSDTWGVNDQQYGQGGHDDYTQHRVTQGAGKFRKVLSLDHDYSMFLDYHEDGYGGSHHPRQGYIHEDDPYNYDGHNDYLDDDDENMSSRYHHRNYSASQTPHESGYNIRDEYNGHLYHGPYHRRMFGNNQTRSRLPQYRHHDSSFSEQPLGDNRHGPGRSRRFQYREGWNENFDDEYYAHGSYDEYYGHGNS
jgi:hypothetical protein